MTLTAPHPRPPAAWQQVVAAETRPAGAFQESGGSEPFLATWSSCPALRAAWATLQWMGRGNGVVQSDSRVGSGVK
jgi:hypothetical protein